MAQMKMMEGKRNCGECYHMRGKVSLVGQRKIIDYTEFKVKCSHEINPRCFDKTVIERYRVHGISPKSWETKAHSCTEYTESNPDKAAI